jgi:hypothetical protein
MGQHNHVLPIARTIPYLTPPSPTRTLDFENQLIVRASRRTDDRQPSSEQAPPSVKYLCQARPRYPRGCIGKGQINLRLLASIRMLLAQTTEK